MAAPRLPLPVVISTAGELPAVRLPSGGSASPELVEAGLQGLLSAPWITDLWAATHRFSQPWFLASRCDLASNCSLVKIPSLAHTTSSFASSPLVASILNDGVVRASLIVDLKGG